LNTLDFEAINLRVKGSASSRTVR